MTVVRRPRLGTVAVVVGLLVLVAATFLRTDGAPAADDGAGDRPLVIAHAGAQGHAPPDTLPAFELALDMGADVLEMDLQLTADGEVVVIHDDTVDRTTEGGGALRDLTLAEVQELDAGYRFEGPDGGFPYRGQGVRIPTFGEVLTAFPDTPIIAELKVESPPEIADATAALLDAHGRRHDVAVASFSVDYIQRFRDLLPDVPTNMPEGELQDFYLLQVLGLDRWWSPPGELLQVPEIHEGLRVVTPLFVAAAERHGTAVQVWTVNERDDMHRLLNLGVAGIMTDYPDRLVDVLAEREAAAAQRGDADLHAGMGWIHTLQDAASWATPVATVITWVGDEEFYLLVFPLIYWSVRRRLGVRVGMLLLVSAGLNEALKLAVRSPRPSFLDPAVGLRHEATFGIPSGHSQNAVAVWGYLGAAIRRRWAVVAAVALIGLLGWSRMQLGVHFPQDTLVGWVVGAVLLGAFLRWQRPAADWLGRRTDRQQLWLAFAASLALVLAAGVARATAIGWTPPAGWIGMDPSEPPIGLRSVVTPAAALYGFAVGLVFLLNRGGFESDGPLLHRAARYPVGLVGVVAIWAGLDAIFPDGDDLVALVYRYARYGLVGFWVGGLAPLFFVRLGLAPRGYSSSSPR